MRASIYILGVFFALDGVSVGAVASRAGMNTSRSSARLAFSRSAGRSTPSFGSSSGRPGCDAAAPGGVKPAFSPPLTFRPSRRGSDQCNSDHGRSHGRSFSRAGIRGGTPSWGTTGRFSLHSSRGAVRGTAFVRRSLSLGPFSGTPGDERGGARGRLMSLSPSLSSSTRASRLSPPSAAHLWSWAASSPHLPCCRQRRSSRPASSLSGPALASGLAPSAWAASWSTRSSLLAFAFSSSADRGGATSADASSDSNSNENNDNNDDDDNNNDYSSSAQPTAIDGSGGGGGGGNTNIDGEAGTEWPSPHPTQDYIARARCGQRYKHDVETGGATRIRAVVSDLDGTLLGPNKLVSATTLRAVREARARGIIFVPASGRSKAGMISSMGELGQDLKRDGAPLVCMNGLTVYGQAEDGGDHGDIIHSELMCSKLAAQVVAFWKTHPLAQAAGVSLCGSEGETIVVESLDARTRSFTDYREPLPREVGNWEDAIAGGMELNRLYFWGETRAAVDAFQDDLKAHLENHPAELTRGVPEMIEVLPHGASKAVGLEALLNHLGVSPHEVIALGDMENDVEMLQAVGHGVAMGQAGLEVRQAAQFTAPSNALDGVAVALETFCGVRPSS